MKLESLLELTIKFKFRYDVNIISKTSRLKEFSVLKIDFVADSGRTRRVETRKTNNSVSRSCNVNCAVNEERQALSTSH